MDLDHDLADYGEPDIDLDAPPPTLEGSEQANRFLRRIRMLEAQRVEIERVALAEIERVRAWAHERDAALEGQTRWLATSVEQFMRAHHAASKAVTLKLPNGELKLRPFRYSVVVDDAAAFVKWATENFPEAVTQPATPDPKPDARLVAAAIGDMLHEFRSSGETRDDGKLVVELVVDGGEVVPGVRAARDINDRVFSIGKAGPGGD